MVKNEVKLRMFKCEPCQMDYYENIAGWPQAMAGVRRLEKEGRRNENRLGHGWGIGELLYLLSDLDEGYYREKFISGGVSGVYSTLLGLGG